MLFEHSESLAGIFHYLKIQFPDTYSSLFNTTASSSNNNERLPKYAFDFDDSTYWTASTECEPNPSIAFCFIDYKVKITGFELQNSNQGCRVTDFLFGGSNNHTQYEYHEFSSNAQRNEVFYNTFQSRMYYQCFKYIALTNRECSGYRTDIAQIELYGELLPLSAKVRLELPTCEESYYLIKGGYLLVFLFMFT